MAGTYYAWSSISTGVDEHGKARKSFKPGDKVAQADLGVSEDEWNALVEEGVVREQEYPKGALESGQSPREYFTAQMARAAEGNLTADDVKELKKAGVEVEDVSATK